MLKYLIVQTNRNFFPTIKNSPYFLMFGLIIFEIFFQYMLAGQRAMDAMGKSGVPVPQIVLVLNILTYILGVLAFSFFLALAITLSARALMAGKTVSWGPALKELSIPLTKESLRALGRVLLWFFVLIIPGVYWYMRYFLVPYVVILEPEYQKGNVDALKLSDFLSQGYGWPIFAYMAISTAASSLRIQDFFDIVTEPVMVFFMFVAWALIQIYFVLMSYFLYQYLYDIKKPLIQKILNPEVK